MIRTYSKLISLPTFEERFEYLKLQGKVGEETFGRDRYLNQILYKQKRWRKIRQDIIIRDKGYDLGVLGFDIYGVITVHHMNPITVEDAMEGRDWVYDPEYLISTSDITHKAIHYGDGKQLPRNVLIIRTPGDTCPWK
jgi:hypothetical protein